MTNKYDLWAPVGSKEELVKDIRNHKSTNNERELIVRAINQKELIQLLEDGPEKFLFHKGVHFGYDYRGHVVDYAMNRSGTIITTIIKDEEIFHDYIDKKEDFGSKKIDRRKVLIDFYAKVNVYNDQGYSWDELENRKGSPDNTFF